MLSADAWIVTDSWWWRLSVWLMCPFSQKSLLVLWGSAAAIRARID
jgi:hypothetical protein